MICDLLSRPPKSSLRICAAAVTLAVATFIAPLARGATISYGSFGPVPPGVSFLNVEESSATDPVPLYGPPVPFATGLDFSPQNFVATKSNGGTDLTDGQLNFTVRSNAGPISFVNLFERGDYTLLGAGTAATQVQAGAVLLATVTAINGAPVAPINLAPVNASVAFNLLANSGITQPWSLGLGLNVAAQVPGATRIDVVINDTLFAGSEANSSAFIAKKDFIIDVDIPIIPEPTSVLLVMVGVFGGSFIRLRGRR